MLFNAFSMLFNPFPMLFIAFSMPFNAFQCFFNAFPCAPGAACQLTPVGVATDTGEPVPLGLAPVRLGSRTCAHETLI